MANQGCGPAALRNADLGIEVIPQCGTQLPQWFSHTQQRDGWGSPTNTRQDVMQEFS